ncbi:MAG: hypothetical protein NXH91_08880 [Phyllobacteriaceae bacterium]|jgi:hypothetical protein|nr:hypothetical protein [Phyllobacteriaceae bacterium]
MSTVVAPEGGARPTPTINPLAWRRWWLGIDCNDRVIAWAQTLTGQAMIHVILLTCLALMPVIRLNHVALIAVSLFLCWVFPHRRMMVVALMGTTYFLLRPFKHGQLYDYFDQTPLAGMTAWASLPADLLLLPFGLVFLVFAFAMMWNHTHKRVRFVSDYPLLSMTGLGVLLTSLTVMMPQNQFVFLPAWLALSYLTSTFFFLGYVLIDMRSKTPLPLSLRLGFMRPFWAGFFTPIKGPAYFVKFEANSDRDLAVSRLKGLKLIVWASILFFIWEWGFQRLIYGHLAFPKLDVLIAAVAAGDTVYLGMRWAAVGVDFMAMVIMMGAAMHAIVAAVRVAGFAIPRGMVRPLASRTIAEFWGRYLFYFKEMLVDFFFYPAFRRYFKNSPRLRMAFATFCAAFIGNVFFDFFHALPLIAISDSQVIWQGFVSYCVYAGILTAGIIWSQQFQRAPKPEHGWFRYNVLPRMQVIVFFALLQVVDDSLAVVPIGERLSYLIGLFGVSV